MANAPDNQHYTLVVYTENMVGLLSRITGVFTRRHINIESLTVSETEIKGISRFTIVVVETADMMRKVVGQIRKIVEVIHADFYEDPELISSQVGLFKVQMRDPNSLISLESLAAQNNARILARYGNNIVLEKTGNRAMLEAFLRELNAYGSTEYVRSGRVSLSVVGLQLREILPQLPELNGYADYPWQVDIDGV